MNQKLGPEEERRQGAGREKRGKERRWLVGWEARLSGLPSKLQSKSQEVKRRAFLSAPNASGCRISLWLSLGLPSRTSRAQKLPGLPGPCLLHGPTGGRGVGVEGRGARKAGAMTPQVWGIPGLLHKRMQRRAGPGFLLDGENGDPEKGFMGDGLGLHGRGGWG